MKKNLIVLFLALVLVNTGWAQEVTTLKRYTTYETALTKEDIITSFVNEVKSYLRKYSKCYCLVRYEVYQDKDEQNYAWSTSTLVSNSLGFSIYTIRLQLSNAHFDVRFGDDDFNVGGQSAEGLMTWQFAQHIKAEAEAMFTESTIALKMYNKSYSDSVSSEFLKQIFWLHNYDYR
ncbi:MAG: hypothetical protein Ta2A_12620 [Treponemataceae bacterium]|nr:MAG: hypothetical protein Ta2A_12620 [Treponemataceae bacterium]